jgi:hypothetical protein
VPSTALLVSVTAQDIGTFDRVTFTFTGTTFPVVLQAAYQNTPATFSPSGNPVTPPIAGTAYIQIVMSGASGVDLSKDPPVTTYTGPNRFSVNLPNVTELVELEDFESTLSWAIGVNDPRVASSVVFAAEPTRVMVDIPHASGAVPVQPSFTG